MGGEGASAAGRKREILETRITEEKDGQVLAVHRLFLFNGKLFGLRGVEHRNLTIANFEVGFNYIRFEENISKTYHGGLFDLKYAEFRVVKHVCHSLNVKHDHCLVDLYNLFIRLVSENAKEVNAFYFKPNCKKFSFDKVSVCINTLNSILLEIFERAGLKRKTAHSLRVTCASSLFNGGVDETLIREKTGQKDNALLKYEKGNEMNLAVVSGLLGLNANKAKVTAFNVATDSKVITEESSACLS